MGVLSMERIEQAYQATGLIPEQLHAAIIDGKCCVIGAIYVNDTGIRLDASVDVSPIYDHAVAEFGRHAAIGLRSGFDDWAMEIEEYYGSGYEEYQRGYLVGREALENLKPNHPDEVIAAANRMMLAGRKQLT